METRLSGFYDGYSATCSPVPAPNMSEKKLLEREQCALDIASALLKGESPFMDQHFGAGKTSLGFKFRDVLKDFELWDPVLREKLGDQYRTLEKEPAFKALMGAVYIHVNWSSCNVHVKSGASQEQMKDEIDKKLCEQILFALCLSVGCPKMPPACSLKEFPSALDSKPFR